MNERRKVAVVLAGELALLAALFGGAEWFVRRRVAGIPPATVASGAAHPPYFNNPGKETAPRAFAYNLTYHIDPQGLRGADVGPKKPGVKRVLILGDSVVFGALVGEDATVAVQLDALLKKRGGNWEVLNGGVGGYDAWDYEGFLRMKGWAFEPDLVIVGMYMNDHVPRDVFEATSRSAANAETGLWSKIRGAAFHSELVNACLYVIQRHQRAKGPPVSFHKPLKPEDARVIEGYFPGDPQSAAAVEKYLEDYRYAAFQVKDTLPWLLNLKMWENIRGPLAGIKAMCAERHVPVLVSIFPAQIEVLPGYRWPEPHRTIAGIVAGLGLPFLDLQPVFAATGHGDELYPARYDMAHPDREAYALAAQAYLDKMAALGWLK
jgi:hypothetical protein